MTPEDHRVRDLELRDRNHQDWICLAKDFASRIACAIVFVTVAFCATALIVAS